MAGIDTRNRTMPASPSRPSLAPYLSCTDARSVIDFCQAAFGAVEVMRWIDPENGKIGHAELRLGGQSFFLADEYPQTSALGVKSPLSLGGSSFHFWLVVDDVEAVTARAVAAGGTLLRGIEQGQDGRRSRVRDPGGHVWSISSH